ncbi:MAG: hypothetical protein KDC74_04635 [Flavobacteriaceae bacterium]|nr:hypothetical protein [Flavobacteriaceae bacterium]
MNRLFIIGNGFDLAHGLPTSYNHFINDYWTLGIDGRKNDDLIQLDISGHIDTSGIESFKDLQILFANKRFFPNLRMKPDDLSYRYSDGSIALYFKNEFFRLIMQRQNIENWVDIENLYYTLLKEIAIKETRRRKYSKDIKTLNKEFDIVKDLLEKYLKEKVLDFYDFEGKESMYWSGFYNVMKPISIFNNEHSLFKEFNSTKDILDLEELLKIERSNGQPISTAYYLNFNYTPTTIKYLELIGEEDVTCNHIHGKVTDFEYPIVFGFGDEMDDDYKKTENIDDNEYLRNFKSFQYLQNSKYDELLSFINRNKYQIIIMGHSCGLSDRVLLNNLFEHENCKSIKIFYHQKGDVDNYTEIIQNISRHFNDKALMRKKIVNKTLCKPLPQTEIPKK